MHSLSAVSALRGCAPRQQRQAIVGMGQMIAQRTVRRAELLLGFQRLNQARQLIAVFGLEGIQNCA